jgi:hypothetical protein
MHFVFAGVVRQVNSEVEISKYELIVMALNHKVLILLGAVE